MSFYLTLCYKNYTSTSFCMGCRAALVGINSRPGWGLYHGVIGTVLGIVYKKKKNGPHFQGTAQEKLPVYVLVDFPQYKGPNFY